MYQWGGPEIEGNGVRTSMRGYSNLIAYDFLLYPVRSESGLRPYLAGGAGIKVYTGTDIPFVGQGPTANLALLRPETQVEPAISVGGGLKYHLIKHLQFRIEVHAYFSPAPSHVIRPVRYAEIRGWLNEVVPNAGFSYVF
jgi:hypothetical protein